MATQFKTESEGVIESFSNNTIFTSWLEKGFLGRPTFPALVDQFRQSSIMAVEPGKVLYNSKEYIALWEGLGDHIWVGTVDTNYIIKPSKTMLNMIKYYL